MLTKLDIKDFQSVSHVEMDAGQYTVIVGRSNSGKSAILRALHVLVRNSFIPSYVRTGASNTHISATFDDLTVSTTRGKESTYTYALGDAAPEVYTKCGRGVPEEIEHRLALPLVAEEDVFFTNQFELPFLVAGKASRASSVMGVLTNAILVNALTQEANRVRLNTKQKITVRQEDLSQLESEWETFSDLPELEAILTDVQSLYAEYSSVTLACAELLRRVQDIKSVTPVVVPTVPPVGALIAKLGTLDAQLEKISFNINRMDLISKVPIFDVPDISEWEELDVLERQSTKLRKMIKEILIHKNMCIQALKDLESVDSEKDRVNKHLGAFEVCPTCGQVIS